MQMLKCDQHATKGNNVIWLHIVCLAEKVIDYTKSESSFNLLVEIERVIANDIIGKVMYKKWTCVLGHAYRSQHI